MEQISSKKILKATTQTSTAGPNQLAILITIHVGSVSWILHTKLLDE